MTKDITKDQGLTPATDILELEDGFHIVMDLPGVKPEDLTVDVEEQELTIKGVSSYVETGGARSLLREFGGSLFQRRFSLSDLVDRDKVEAGLRDGVLQIRLPKAEALRPKRIKIA